MSELRDFDQNNNFRITDFCWQMTETTRLNWLARTTNFRSDFVDLVRVSLVVYSKYSDFWRLFGSLILWVYFFKIIFFYLFRFKILEIFGESMQYKMRHKIFTNHPLSNRITHTLSYLAIEFCSQREKLNNIPYFL